MSLRKHISQMSKEEVNLMWSELYKVGSENWVMTLHTINRALERGGSKDDIINTLYNGEIIEYHLRDNRNRALVRGTRNFNGYVMCVVYEPKSKNIITVYWNKDNDKHYTINMSQYSNTLNIVDKWQECA